MANRFVWISSIVMAVVVVICAWLFTHSPIRDLGTIAASAVAIVYCASENMMNVDYSVVAPYDTEGFAVATWVSKQGGDRYHAWIFGSSASAVYVSRLHGCVLEPLSQQMEEAYLNTLHLKEGRKFQSSNPLQSMKEAISALSPKSEPLVQPTKTHTHSHDDFGDKTLCDGGDARFSLGKKRALQELFDKEIRNGVNKKEHTRALVAVQCGELLAESYAGWLNMTAESALLGWSMTKSVTSALVGIAIRKKLLNLDDLIDLDKDGNLEEESIRLRHLLHMVDGLDYNEHYGFVSDPARMLFLERSTAAFAQSKLPVHEPGIRWCYNSGATNIVSRHLRDSFSSWSQYWSFPYIELFGKIGATSFLLQTDPEGVFVGSSFGYATARDWARFGVLLLQNGSWNGNEIISSNYLNMFMFRRLEETDGLYSGGWWHPPTGKINLTLLNSDPRTNCLAHYLKEEAWSRECLPQETILAAGYKGQYVIIIPSQYLVLVRLGHLWEKSNRIRFFKSVFHILNRN